MQAPPSRVVNPLCGFITKLVFPEKQGVGHDESRAEHEIVLCSNWNYISKKVSNLVLDLFLHSLNAYTYIYV